MPAKVQKKIESKCTRMYHLLSKMFQAAWAVCLELKDETLTGLEIKVLGEVEVATSKNILHLGGIADDLCITRYIHRGGLAGAWFMGCGPSDP